MCAVAGLSPVVRGSSLAAQRVCGGSQGRLRTTRAARPAPCGQPGSIPTAAAQGFSSPKTKGRILNFTK